MAAHRPGPTLRHAGDDQIGGAALMAALVELSRALVAPQTVEEISLLVLSHAKRLTGSAYGFAGYLDPETGDLICSTLTQDVWDECDIPNKQAVFKRCRGLLGLPMDNRRAAVSNDAVHDPRRAGTPLGHVPIERFLGAPALVGDTLIGQVALANADHDYTEQDKLLVERLASFYALALQRKRMEEALRRERDLAAAVLNTVGALVLVLDTEGRIAGFNRRCEQTTGYRFAEVQGKPFWDLFLLEQEREGVEAVFADLRAGRFPNEHRNFWVTRRGALRRIAWTNTALLDEGGAVQYVIATGIDVTEREQVQQEYQTVLKTAIDGFWIYDGEGRILEVNGALCRMVGYAREELVGMRIADLEAGESGQEAAPYIQRAAEQGWDRFESRLRRKDGTMFDCGVSVSHFEGSQRFFAFVRDISERKEAERARQEEARGAAIAEERTRLARELHDSVTQSLYSLTLMADGWRRMAGAGRLDDLQQPLAELGGIAQQALKELRLMVYELRPPALGQAGLVGALRQRLALVEQRAGVEARVVAGELAELPPAVEDGLFRIAIEALNNALKHAAATAVTVSLRAVPDGLELEVSDNGRGFDLGVGEAGGVGLDSMRERAARLGGRFDLRSAPGQGTKVRVTV